MKLISENMPFLNVIRAMAVISPLKDVRTMLTCANVYYREGSIVGIATCSGHLMLTVGHVGGIEDCICIPAKSLKLLITSLEVKDIDDSKDSLVTRLETLGVDYRENESPNLNRILNKFISGKGADTIGVSACYLSTVDKVTKAITKKLPDYKAKFLGVKLKPVEETGLLVNIKLKGILFNLCLASCRIDF